MGVGGDPNFITHARNICWLCVAGCILLEVTLKCNSCIKHQLGTVFVIDTYGREREKAGQREKLS